MSYGWSFDAVGFPTFDSTRVRFDAVRESRVVVASRVAVVSPASRVVAARAAPRVVVARA